MKKRKLPALLASFVLLLQTIPLNIGAETVLEESVSKESVEILTEITLQEASYEELSEFSHPLSFPLLL